MIRKVLHMTTESRERWLAQLYEENYKRFIAWQFIVFDRAAEA